jgi:CBS domain-containing protein
MIDSDVHMLPVFAEEGLQGVVTADGILEIVREYLDAADVEDAYSRNLVTVTPETTVGKALNVLRENRITHLPVVENSTAVGILSLYNLTDFTVRSIQQSQGGDAGGTDSFGGDISSSAASSGRGGYGAREGELERMLDLPVRDVMVSPVRTMEPEETLDEAVDEMFTVGSSSLVVTEEDRPVGILTKTDILETLTWEAGGNRAVQIYGIDHLDDITYDEVVSMIDTFDDRDHGMNVLDARIHLHKHDEKRRGVPLLLARIRLHTDHGLYMASGEGYGASHALNEARDVLERRIRDEKTYGQTKKPPTEEFWEKRFGWLLEK